MCIKGGSEQEAVLCSDKKTYRIRKAETTNTLLLVQPEGSSDAGEHFSVDGVAGEQYEVC